ncbi:MAG: right-handed parallel beta-helix repeat-containing protein, partial [Caldilineaceae bacterium]|nr:right-handed parallel beta-helix repeat-containing protein [Caldilineaceae bacterium]
MPNVVVRYVDAGATGSGDGSSWDNAYTNLPVALAASSYGTQLWIAEGTYVPSNSDRTLSFTLRDGVSLYGGFPLGGGDGTFAARIPTAHPTILSGDIGVQGDASDNSAHVLRGDNSIGREIVVDGVVIAGGNANADAPHNRGGGLYLTGGVVTLRNCIIRDNRAEGGAPAVFASDGATLTIDGCVIESNSTPGEGSAVQIDDGSATLIDNTIIRNNAGAFGIGPLRLVRGTSTVRNTV